MTVRSYLKCEVCGAITIVRLQVGWLDHHPIAVPCGRCGITISGEARFDETTASVDLSFDNAERVDEVEAPDFYMEISGELPTTPLRALEGEAYQWSPPPFFQAIHAMGHENYASFQNDARRFLYEIDTRWKKVVRLNELWHRGDRGFVGQEVKELLPSQQFPPGYGFPAENGVDCLRGVHMATMFFFESILENDSFITIRDLLFEQIQQLAIHKTENFKQLLLFFSQHQMLKTCDERLFHRCQKFVSSFRYLLPAFACLFYESPQEVEQLCISTATFDDLKHYYAETYEVLADVAALVVAYNNVTVRDDFKIMKTRRRDVVHLEDYLGKNKGERLQYLDGSEPFDQLLYPGLDNKLRNAIAHSTYLYDPGLQVITYYPSGEMGVGESRKISLLGFARECWALHQRVLYSMALVYQTMKMKYILIDNEWPSNIHEMGIL